MIQLPTIQANALKIVFEEQFDPEEIYFEYVDIDEIFNALIGGEVDSHFYDMLEATAKVDEFNRGFMVMIYEYIDTIRIESVELEFFELANNCKELNKRIKKIIKDNE